MPRPPSWNSPATAIRVPVHLSQQLLAIARCMDAGDSGGYQGFVQNPDILITVKPSTCYSPSPSAPQNKPS
ncbi:MAG: hypothetical protein IGR92_03315 [Leptolyngbyaceae cyanobacterium T60_A2020_046]|nr:hypothetical protein [Leptolyngbyaceae cyanobacterium T60_A2020_046]